MRTMRKFTLSPKEMELLRRLGVEAVILFGSHAQGTAGPMSDFDFGVLTNHSGSASAPLRRKEIYDTLYDLLSSKIKQLVNVDIVFLTDASMELQSHAAKFGIPLYEGNPHALPRFRERVMDIYSDFAPLRELFSKAIFKRIISS